MLISLVGLAPLQALGLQAVIREESPEDEVLVPGTGDAEGWQRAACFIVSATALASHAHFFMPRLSQVLLLTSAPQMETGRGLPVLSPLASKTEIKAAVSRLRAGASTVCRQPHPGESAPSAPLPLTRRELDVLRLTARGASAKEVASQLGISVNTVLTHRKNITDKLDIHGTPALIYFALKHHIL